MTKTVSLFSGCGGLDLGFINAGFNIIYANDFDKYAVQSYAHNIGDHIIEGDLSQIDAKDIPTHDVLIGGFPCQPFSMMGSKQGFLDDVRGTLFFDVARIISTHLPKVVVLENVRNLRTHDKGRTLNTIINTLESLNYTVQVDLLNSVEFGVPQVRNRLFIVCIRNDIAAEMENPYTFPTPTILDTTQVNLQSVLEENVDSKYYLSHKILPTILAHGSGNYYSKSEIDLTIARPLTATMAKMHRANQDNYVTVPSKQAEAAGKTNIRRLTPRECARLQGFPDSYEIIVSDTQAYRQFGNAVTVNVAECIAISLKKAIPALHFKEALHV
ncbi:DNA cytosine methyltransferase [Psychrobacillus soli]|uniref:Cytosine-specific methyltransferase n=1 Tax=Psychrobacillus soli TaxID=1543965 RepID=A0A544T2F9_9BACI|nr:DNA cytosine methyltransferase [Psychrobacillus soli]TQR11646.1 DNA cytosine methyltransferase [Psychrobacillus soli]